MICAHANEDTKFIVFSLYLKQILKGDYSYKENIFSVIKDTQELTLGKKNFYTIDRYNYSIIVYLSSKDPSFFESIDMNNIGEKEYSTLLGYIESQRQICCA